MVVAQGTLEVRAAPRHVWPLLVDPLQLPRYADGVTRVEVLAGDPERVGAYTVAVHRGAVGSNARPVSSTTLGFFVREVEPLRRYASEGTAGLMRMTSRYELAVVFAQDVPRVGPRDAAPPPGPVTLLRYRCEFGVAGAGAWLVTAVALGLPLIGLFQAKRAMGRIMERLVRVAEDDARREAAGSQVA